ncbi:unnamed protein product, partial [Adineta steineri]
MTQTPLNSQPYDQLTASTDDVSDKNITDLFHRIIDSFKRAPHSESVPIDMNQRKERANLINNIEKDETGLHRTLKNRHLQMITIGGAIGTGLFISSGT